MTKHGVSIHVFRRDLRLDDNTALISALNSSEQVIPVFIFDKRQIESPFRGNNSFAFMLNSLLELDCQLKTLGSELHVFQGIAHEVLESLIDSTKANAVYFNRDYTPFSRQRDEQIAALCAKKGLVLELFADALLTEPELVHKDDGTPYTVFTPFMKRARLLAISKPVKLPSSNFFKGSVSGNLGTKFIREQMPEIPLGLIHKGGRNEALVLLSQLQQLNNYDQSRNMLALKGTSLLSPHHKFGTISIRETYQQINEHFGNQHTLTNELYWRDFFTHILFHFPHVLGNAFREKYRRLEWKTDKGLFEQWSQGQTGFPVIDAAMHELVETGYMHNRARMIVASFLVKDLHLDWRLGEQFLPGTLPITTQLLTMGIGSGQHQQVAMHNLTSAFLTLGANSSSSIHSAFISKNGYLNCSPSSPKPFIN
jgi:deoxyribodipyrimidine photo-lyase